jgi:hypothetical protein
LSLRLLLNCCCHQKIQLFFLRLSFFESIIGPPSGDIDKAEATISISVLCRSNKIRQENCYSALIKQQQQTSCTGSYSGKGNQSKFKASLVQQSNLKLRKIKAGQSPIFANMTLSKNAKRRTACSEVCWPLKTVAAATLLLLAFSHFSEGPRGALAFSTPLVISSRSPLAPRQRQSSCSYRDFTRATNHYHQSSRGSHLQVASTEQSSEVVDLESLRGSDGIYSIEDKEQHK